MVSIPRLATHKLGELRMQGNEMLTAASGVVSLDNDLYVVPDDGLALGRFDKSLQKPGVPCPMFPDAPLPEDHAARKKAKPDLESLTLVQGWFPERKLMSVGSGSTQNRERGVLMPVGSGESQPFDLKPLYGHLRAQFPDLNIEGLALQGNLLRLVQRGNGENSRNAIIDLDAARFFQSVQQSGSVGPEALVRTKEVELGTLDGVKLTFTDLAPTPDGHFLFTASAEDTSNPYDDGKVAGSVVGRMHRDGTIELMGRLDRDVKIEGVDISEDGQIRVVTDHDDPHRPAEVFGLNDPQEFLLAR